MFEPRHILDVQVHRVTLAGVRDRLDQFVRSGHPHQIVTVNMDFVRLARDEPEFCRTVNSAALAVPDGVPVLWAARLLGTPLLDRVTGVDIVEHGAALAAEQGYRIYLLGAEPGVAEAAAAELRHRYPTLTIAGCYSPPVGPFSAEEEAAMIERIRAARPEMLFVAFGAPRQDVWINRHLETLDVPVCVGVGGTFNFLAGRVPRAPAWMQRHGLEWAYRLSREPRRLWRRYLIEDLPVFLRIVGIRLAPAASLRRRLAQPASAFSLGSAHADAAGD